MRAALEESCNRYCRNLWLIEPMTGKVKLVICTSSSVYNLTHQVLRVAYRLYTSVFQQWFILIALDFYPRLYSRCLGFYYINILISYYSEFWDVICMCRKSLISTILWLAIGLLIGDDAFFQLNWTIHEWFRVAITNNQKNFLLLFLVWY